jgi:hypothetical protein
VAQPASRLAASSVSVHTGRAARVISWFMASVVKIKRFG